MSSESKPLPFIIGNAFTDDIGGGNPAAIVFSTPEIDASLSNDTRQTIAANFNQLMTAFVSPLFNPSDEDGEEKDPQTATFAVRYFTSMQQVSLCVHATLVAAKSIFASSSSSSPLVPPTTTILRFQTADNATITARLSPPSSVEVTASYSNVVPLSSSEPRDARLRAALAKALPSDVKPIFLGTGEEYLERLALIEVDTPNLGAVKVNIPELLDSGFAFHALTAPPSRTTISSPSSPLHAFESRMFAPAAGVPEDPVCGSAHCLIMPYWSAKLGLEPGVEVKAKQVSWRGGELGLTMENDATAGKRELRLKGEVSTTTVDRLDMYRVGTEGDVLGGGEKQVDGDSAGADVEAGRPLVEEVEGEVRTEGGLPRAVGADARFEGGVHLVDGRETETARGLDHSRGKDES